MFPSNKLIVPFLNLVSIGFKKVSFINLKIKSLRERRYEKAVIVSVDNLSFGGTGKTTLTAWIAGKLREQGIKFAIVTRGYKAKQKESGFPVRTSHTAVEVGDEAKLLKTRFPDQDVFIGKNRHASIMKAIQRKNRVIILDDGFQSTDIYKDIKIMLYNPLQPYYYLRNFKFLMKEEDYILFYSPAGDAVSEKPGMKVYGDTPAGTYYFVRENFYDVNGNIIEVGDSAFLGFSALGDNRRFKNDLKELNLTGFRSYKDHYAFTGEDIEYLENLRKELKADYLVCTEKDYVKLMNLDLKNIPLIFAKNIIKVSIDLTAIILEHNSKKKSLFFPKSTT